MEDWKSLREKAGLTLEQLAVKAGWAKGTIADLENHGRGGPRLKSKLREILAPLSQFSASEQAPSSASETSGVAKFVDRPDDLTLEQWKRRAILAEDRLEQLQANIRAALSISTAPSAPLSSTARLSEAQSIVKASGAAYDAAHHPKK